MEAHIVQNIFIQILRSELQGTRLEPAVREQLTDSAISALHELARQHDLAHVVFASLYRQGLLTGAEQLARFKREEVAALYRNVRMEYAFEQICGAFDGARLPYIPLKGAVLRPYYPKAHMRTSCDIDILVREQDLDRAIGVLTDIGYKSAERNYHDVSLFSPNQIHLELHFSIRENSPALDRVLQDAWEHALPERGSCWRFTDAFFVFYLYAHMAYHFRKGGCGVRSLMDLWIMEHRMGLNWTVARELLETAGIARFAEQMEKLSGAVFSGEPGDALSDTVLTYIVRGGSFGDAANRFSMVRSQGYGRFAYLWRKVFVPYRTLAPRYPLLQKLPVLLPVFWLVRLAVRPFQGKAKQVWRELQHLDAVDADTADAMARMCRYLEL